jgi:hypothetical protein
MRSRRHRGNRENCKPLLETKTPLEFYSPPDVETAPDEEIPPPPPPPEPHPDTVLWEEMVRLYRINGPEAVRKKYTVEQLTRMYRIQGVTWMKPRATKADMIAVLFR